MSVEPVYTETPLAVMATHRPSDRVYARAARLSSRPSWLFSVSFGIAACFLMLAAVQLPSFLGVSTETADRLFSFQVGSISAALAAWVVRLVFNRKAKKQQEEMRARRDDGLPSVYRFYADRVECLKLRERFAFDYTTAQAVLEDRDGFYLLNEGLLLIVPSAELTPLDVSYVRAILREYLPSGVYRCRRQAVGLLQQPNSLPLYPDREVLPPQVKARPQYLRPTPQAFLPLVTSLLPLLLVLLTAVTSFLILLCDLQGSWMPTAMLVALLLLSFFPLYVFSFKHQPPQLLLGLSRTDDGWRIYHVAGEFFAHPYEVFPRRNGGSVLLFTPYGTMTATAEECRQIPELAARIDY